MQIVGPPMVLIQLNRLNHLLPLIYKLGLLVHCPLRGKIGKSTSNKQNSSHHTAATNTSERSATSLMFFFS